MNVELAIHEYITDKFIFERKINLELAVTTRILKRLKSNLK